MPNKFSSGKYSIAECDRCGQRYKLKQLRKLTIKTKQVSIKVCPECWEPDQPQLQLGMYPVNDPQAVREPRTDTSYAVSGQSGLQLNLTGGPTEEGFGYPEMGSRVFQWGWNPVGGSREFDNGLTPDDLKGYPAIGTVGFILGRGVFVPVKGLQAVGLIGDVEVIAEANVNADGVLGTVEIGDEVVTADANVLPIGVQATGSTNDVETICECVVDAFGVQANVGLGEEVIVAEANTDVYYVAATALLGNPVYIMDSNVNVTGLTGTTTVGNETVIEGTGVSFGVTGESASVSQGTVSVLATGYILFTSGSFSFTIPTAISSVNISAAAGGGGGGSGSFSNADTGVYGPGGGGGGGAYLNSVTYSLTTGDVIFGEVGAGGAGGGFGGVYQNGVTGSAGVRTYIHIGPSEYVYLGQGTGGTGGNIAGYGRAIGGSGGIAQYDGSNGMDGFGGDSFGSDVPGYAGGNSFGLGGAGGSKSGGDNPGLPGTQGGGGGGGSAHTYFGDNRGQAGGRGGDGFVLITW
jgi:hypothetical protein